MLLQSEATSSHAPAEGNGPGAIEAPPVLCGGLGLVSPPDDVLTGTEEGGL